jgi:hypothetical protein
MSLLPLQNLRRSEGQGAVLSHPPRRTARFTRVLAAFAVASALTANAGALEPAVTLGRISLAPGQTLALRDLLGSALREELAAAPLSKLRSREQYVLSARLQKLDTRRTPKWSEATCSVSVLLKRKSDDALLAVVSGRATAQDSHPAASQSAALRAAVRGAMKRVPAAVAQLRR